MADPNAPAAPPPVGTPAPAASSQSVTVDPSDAGRALASRRAEIRAKLMKEAAPADPKGATPAATAGHPAEPTATAPATGTGAPTADDDEIAVLIEAQRKQGETAKQLDARKADLDRREAALTEAEKEAKEYVPSVKAAREALAKGDHMGALLAVFPGDLVVNDLFWAISKHVDEHGGEKPAAPIDLDAEFKKRLHAWQEEQKAEAQRKAEEAKGAIGQARDARDADMGAGFGASLLTTLKTLNIEGRNVPAHEAPPDVVQAVVGGYADFVLQTFNEVKGNLAKYPAFARIRPTVIQVVERLEELRTASGKVPSVADVAKATEDWLRGPQEAAPPAPRPAPTVTDGWRGGVGKPDPEPAGELTLEQKRAAIRAKLRAPAA